MVFIHSVQHNFIIASIQSVLNVVYSVFVCCLKEVFFSHFFCLQREKMIDYFRDENWYALNPGQFSFNTLGSGSHMVDALKRLHVDPKKYPVPIPALSPGTPCRSPWSLIKPWITSQNIQVFVLIFGLRGCKLMVALASSPVLCAFHSWPRCGI